MELSGSIVETGLSSFRSFSLSPQIMDAKPQYPKLMKPAYGEIVSALSGLVDDVLDYERDTADAI